MGTEKKEKTRFLIGTIFLIFLYPIFVLISMYLIGGLGRLIPFIFDTIAFLINTNIFSFVIAVVFASYFWKFLSRHASHKKGMLVSSIIMLVLTLILTYSTYLSIDINRNTVDSMGIALHTFATVLLCSIDLYYVLIILILLFSGKIKLKKK